MNVGCFIVRLIKIPMALQTEVRGRGNPFALEFPFGCFGRLGTWKELGKQLRHAQEDSDRVPLAIRPQSWSAVRCFAEPS